MDSKELLEYRMKIIEDAIACRKPDRTPHVANYWSWMLLDSGYKLSEALYDYDKYLDSYDRFASKYPFDMLVGDMLRNPVKILGDLGETQYIIDDEQGTMNIKDVPLMGLGDYRLLVDDFVRFLWTVVLPNRAKNFNSATTLDQFHGAFDEFNASQKFQKDVIDLLREKYGITRGMSTSNQLMPALEFLFNFLRGIKGLSTDMRKDPSLVKEAVEALDKIFLDPAIAAIDKTVRPEGQAFDFFSALLSHNILSPKQWDEFLWPSVKKVLDAVVAADKTVVIFSEGSTKRFWDYFKDYPKGHIALFVEQDDIYEFREALPNICAIGGMPTTLLGDGTAKECVDYAKKLIDDLGSEGGFILSQNKMVSFRNDTKPENLKAVCDFVANYR